MSSVRYACMFGVDLRDIDRARSSASAYFVAVVGGISDTYVEEGWCKDRALRDTVTKAV